MSEATIDSPELITGNNRQRVFLRHLTAILIDLAVLNLFEEHWSLVVIDSFTVSLFAAVLLQVLLRLAMRIEHRISAYYKNKPGTFAKVQRYFWIWVVLFGSKFVILGALSVAFGDRVQFGGPLHGLVSLIVVLVVMLLAEWAALKVLHKLGVD